MSQNLRQLLLTVNLNRKAICIFCKNAVQRLNIACKKGHSIEWPYIHEGGDEGDRTPDLLTASQALSQLSYAPVRRSTIRELPRRCKDNFGKTSGGGIARHRPAADRDGGMCPQGAFRPRQRPAGRPPRKPPIYYVWPASPDHTVLSKNKTAGRRPAVFAKSGAWSAGRG